MDKELDVKSAKNATALHSHYRRRDGKKIRRESNL